MSLEQLIFHHTQANPQKTALIQGQTEVTYGQLWKEIERAAAWFKQHASQGGQGDRISQQDPLGKILWVGF